MDLPIRPPLQPMLARLTRDLPADGYLYEPKWDGFRCVVFRDRDQVDLRSRNQRPLARYFPELVTALHTVARRRFVMDGEIVLLRDGRFDFDALMARLHPAESRVRRLAAETPASFIGFDVLAVDRQDLRSAPFVERRRSLEDLLGGVDPPLALTPITASEQQARRWLERFQGAGIDGVIAKPEGLPYEPGKRSMVKVKLERTAECVVAGLRWLVDRPALASMLLGMYDPDGVLRHVGVVSQLSEALRRELLEELRPLTTSIEGHPWEGGFGLGPSPLGRLKGAASRWAPEEMERDWVPLRPERVCEVAYDQVDGDRFRHPARFRRWRPDRDPRSCTLEQLRVPAPELRELVAPR